jgi:hypothetical protein
VVESRCFEKLDGSGSGQILSGDIVDTSVVEPEPLIETAEADFFGRIPL